LIQPDQWVEQEIEMDPITRRLSWLVDHGVVVVFLIMIIVSFLQVFFRYVLNNPLFASEEIARLFAVWLTFLGASAAVKYREHISVDILYIRVSAKAQGAFDLLADMVLFVFHGFLLFEGAKLAYLFRSFESHALRFSMSFFLSAIPITALFTLIFLVHCINKDIQALTARGE
jgi:TRAP-type C4-dicarboxylate transport system permease small subunit